MSFVLGTTLKSVEKVFGPAVAGRGDEAHTVSAVRYAAGQGKRFAGVPGFHPEAVFYIHFALPVNLAEIKSKKGLFDHIKDLSEDGPQARQGRDVEVEAFLKARAEKARLVEEKAKAAAEKKSRLETAKAEKQFEKERKAAEKKARLDAIKAQKQLDKEKKAAEKTEKLLRERVIAEYLAGRSAITFTVDGHTITAAIKVTSAKGKKKVKLSAEFTL